MQTQSIPQNILEAAALVAEIIRRNRTNRLDKSKNLRLVPTTQKEGKTMKESVTKQLAALRHMTIDELREKFSELFGIETSSFNPQQIRKRLAYRIQEVYYGGLTEPEKAILKSIAEKDPLAKLEQSRARAIESIRGTRFSREWHGKVYEVIVTDNGAYEYDGRLFRSLSAIAKEITGTQWNGKLFFGIRADRKGR